MATASREAMRNNGLSAGSGGPFAPHVTIAKLSKVPWRRGQQRPRQIPREAWAACADISGGAVMLSAVQLCRMGVCKTLNPIPADTAWACACLVQPRGLAQQVRHHAVGHAAQSVHSSSLCLGGKCVSLLHFACLWLYIMAVQLPRQTLPSGARLNMCSGMQGRTAGQYYHVEKSIQLEVPC